MIANEKVQARRWLSVWLCVVVIVIVAGTWWAGGLISYWKPEAVGFSERKLFSVQHQGPIDDIFPRFFPACKLANSLAVLPPQVGFFYEEITETELVNIYAESTKCYVVREDNVIAFIEEPWIERHYNGIQDWVKEHLGVSLWAHRDERGRKLLNEL